MYFGCKDLDYISHGSTYSEVGIELNGVWHYYDEQTLLEGLWEFYQEDFPHDEDGDNFDEWLGDNPSLVYSEMENLLFADADCFKPISYREFLKAFGEYDAAQRFGCNYPKMDNSLEQFIKSLWIDYHYNDDKFSEEVANEEYADYCNQYN